MGLKHTVGPWKNDPEHGITFAPDGTPIQTGGAGCCDEFRANAELIAAAPDLFDLCNRAVVILGHPREDEYLDDLRAQILEVVMKLDPPSTASPERICKCGDQGIDARCVHYGQLPPGHPSCDCYSCEEKRGKPKTTHMSACEKRKRGLLSSSVHQRPRDLLVQCHGLAMANGSFDLAREIREVTGLKADW